MKLPRGVAIFILLGVGVLLFVWMYLHAESYNLTLIDQKRTAVEEDAWIQRMVLLLAALLTMLPFTQKPIAAGFNFLRHPSDRARRRTALLVLLLSGPVLYGLGAARGRLGLPIWHDENMYRMQTTFLMHGKLALPGLPIASKEVPHPDPALADHFDTPYVFVRGVFVRSVYAPVYFPGTALLHVPAAMINLPYWFTPMLIASISLMLLYLIVTELVDGLAGIMAVLLMMSLLTFRWLALVEMSHGSGMMWGLAAMWAWLSWRRSHRIGWVILAGAAGGFYAITRPLDAVCILAPIAIAWTCDLRRMSWRTKLATVVVSLAAAAPFLALQLAFDRAVTGNALKSPLDVYNQIYFNVKSIGLQEIDPNFRPPTPVPQIHTLYRNFDMPFIRGFTTVRQALGQWLGNRVPLTWGSTMPTLILVVLLPVALLGLSDSRKWVLWSMSWCYLAGSGFFYIFVPQYTMAAAPAVIFAVVLGASVIQRQWPAERFASVFLPLCVLFFALELLAVNQQNFFEPIPEDGASPGNVSRVNYLDIPAKVKKPALVFVRFAPDEKAWEEPVYNWDVLNPDDAPIIRVHDLGLHRNLELLRYYEKRRPELHVYSFDRKPPRLKDLGELKKAIEIATLTTIRRGLRSVDPFSRLP